MSSHRVYLHYLQDMLGNAEKAVAFVQGMSGDDFLRDEKTVFAVIRALEVMGEAKMLLRMSEINTLTFPGGIWPECAIN